MIAKQLTGAGKCGHIICKLVLVHIIVCKPSTKWLNPVIMYDPVMGPDNTHVWFLLSLHGAMIYSLVQHGKIACKQHYNY